MQRSRARSQLQWDSKSGKTTKWLCGGPDRLHPGGRCYVCGIRVMREGLDVGENARWSRFACKHWRVIRCDGCWDLFDHENQRAPPDLPPAAAGKSRPHTTPSNAKPHGPELPAAPRYPEGHLMHGSTIDGSGLTCDGCGNALGASFFSCCVDECDYDLCLQCSRNGPATQLPPSTTERAERVNDREKTVQPAPLRPKAQRMKSKESLKRAANNLRKAAAAATKGAQKKRESRAERMKKMNAARQRLVKREGSGCKRKRQHSRH